MDKKRTYPLSTEEIASIHAYLYDEVPAAERMAFEHRLDNEPEWRAKVEEVRLLVLGVQEAILADDLGKWQVDLASTANNAPEAGIATDRRPVPLYRRWWVAASLILLAAAATWAIWPKADTPARLYAAFYQPDIGLPVEMSAADESRYRFYDGMISYKEGNYADALAKWSESRASAPASDTLAYYRAMAHMGLGNILAAKPLLETVAERSQTVFHADAAWYLALCSLHLGDADQAIGYLRQIPNDDRARELLNRLE